MPPAPIDPVNHTACTVDDGLPPASWIQSHDVSADDGEFYGRMGYVDDQLA